jgi:hypothetical protein
LVLPIPKTQKGSHEQCQIGDDVGTYFEPQRLSLVGNNPVEDRVDDGRRDDPYQTPKGDVATAQEAPRLDHENSSISIGSIFHEENGQLAVEISLS